METIARRLICGILSCVLLQGANRPVASEEISVWNCGRPGANTRESLARLPGVLAGKPDHLVILANSRSPQRERLADSAVPGWAIEIELPDGKRTQVKSADEGLVPKVAVDEKTGDTRFVWAGLGSGPLADLTVQLAGRQQVSGVAWRLDIGNRGKAAMWNVTFPDLQFPVGKDDMVVIPSVSGRLHSASRPLSYSGQYPSGSLTMQCTGFYGPSGGVYAAVHDPYGSVKRLEMNVKNGHLGIRWQWPVPNMGVPGTQWKTPGDVVIRPFNGDWFDISQIYRAWAEKEAGWWPRGKQAGRPWNGLSCTESWRRANASVR
jgi:hypothetical protein